MKEKSTIWTVGLVLGLSLGGGGLSSEVKAKSKEPNEVAEKKSLKIKRWKQECEWGKRADQLEEWMKKSSQWQWKSLAWDDSYWEAKKGCHWSEGLDQASPLWTYQKQEGWRVKGWAPSVLEEYRIVSQSKGLELERWEDESKNHWEWEHQWIHEGTHGQEMRRNRAYQWLPQEDWMGAQGWSERQRESFKKLLEKQWKLPYGLTEITQEQRGWSLRGEMVADSMMLAWMSEKYWRQKCESKYPRFKGEVQVSEGLWKESWKVLKTQRKRRWTWNEVKQELDISDHGTLGVVTAWESLNSQWSCSQKPKDWRTLGLEVGHTVWVGEMRMALQWVSKERLRKGEKDSDETLKKRIGWVPWIEENREIKRSSKVQWKQWVWNVESEINPKDIQKKL